MEKEPVLIDVWSDFVCPFCFLAAFSLKALKASHEVEVRWRSFQLRPTGSPPISEEHMAAIRAKQPQMRQMAREQYGVEINEGPFGIDSYAALVGAKYAEAQGVGEAYHWAVFQAYWQQAQSIDDTAVLADIAQQVGLDRAAFLAALEQETWQTAVASDVQQANLYNLHSVPAIVFANKYLVSGAQPYPVLVQVAEQVAAERTNGQP